MKNIVNIPASIHDRLQNLAREQNKTLQEILQYYAMERFLYRLSNTEYKNMFVLKGGLIFYALGFPLRRPTRDIDFRGFTANSRNNLMVIIKTVCLTSVPNDGMVFKEDTTQIEETMVDADYLGLRISFQAFLGTIRIPMQIDIGFSDVITPQPQDITYPSLLDGAASFTLRGYSIESIISEKFHAMVVKGDINSRYKDFYDLWVLSIEKDFQGTVLQNAISATFERRATPIQSEIPLALSDEFSTANQEKWRQYLIRKNLWQEPLNDFSMVIQQLRSFLAPPMRAIIENTALEKVWKAGIGWE